MGLWINVWARVGSTSGLSMVVVVSFVVILHLAGLGWRREVLCERAGAKGRLCFRTLCLPAIALCVRLMRVSV